MRRHSEIGHRIALSAPDLEPIADWILKHHEWWNGQGYPLGLKGEEIPLECRILAIADAYDAMTSDRPYRNAKSKKLALDEIRRFAGVQFDPDLVEKLLKLIIWTKHNNLGRNMGKNRVEAYQSQYFLHFTVWEKFVLIFIQLFVRIKSSCWWLPQRKIITGRKKACVLAQAFWFGA